MFVMGCTPKEPAQKPSAPPAGTMGEATSAVDRLAPMPEPLVVMTAVPAAITADTDILDTGDVTDVQEDVRDEGKAVQDETKGTHTADAALVFNLSEVELDVAALRERGIELHELNDVRILMFATNSSALILPVRGLPTGSCPRSLIVIVRQNQMTQSRILEYGRSAPREHFLFCVAYIPNAYMLSGYEFDIAYTDAKPEKWYALAATYDGNNLTLYANGAAVQSREGNLNTYPSERIAIGSGFDGSIAGVKIWNRELSADEVAAQSAAMLRTHE